jgi:hypothetical protein
MGGGVEVVKGGVGERGYWTSLENRSSIGLYNTLVFLIVFQGHFSCPCSVVINFTHLLLEKYYFFKIFYFIIHMCIQDLGHFSPEKYYFCSLL